MSSAVVNAGPREEQTIDAPSLTGRAQASAVDMQRHASSVAQDKKNSGHLRAEVLPAYQSLLSLVVGHAEHPAALKLGEALHHTLADNLVAQSGPDSLDRARQQLKQLAEVVQTHLSRDDAKASCSRIIQAADLIEREKMIDQLGKYLKDVVKADFNDVESPKPTNGLKALIEKAAARAVDLPDLTEASQGEPTDGSAEASPADLPPPVAEALDEQPDSSNPSPRTDDTPPVAQDTADEAEVCEVGAAEDHKPAPTPRPKREAPISITDGLQAGAVDLCDGRLNLSLQESKITAGQAVCVTLKLGASDSVTWELSEDFLRGSSFQKLKNRLESGFNAADAGPDADAAQRLVSRAARELFGTCAVREISASIQDTALPPILLTPGARVNLETTNCSGGFRVVTEDVAPEKARAKIEIEQLRVKGTGDIYLEIKNAVIHELEVEAGATLAGNIDGAQLRKGSCKVAGRLTGLHMTGLKETDGTSVSALSEETAREMFDGARIRYSLSDKVLKAIATNLTEQANREDVLRLNTARLSILDRRLAQGLESWQADTPVQVPVTKRAPDGKEVLMDKADAAFLVKALEQALGGMAEVPAARRQHYVEALKAGPVVVPAVPLSHNQSIGEGAIGYAVYKPTSAEEPVVLGTLARRSKDQGPEWVSVKEPDSGMANKLRLRLDEFPYREHSEALAELYARRLQHRPKWFVWGAEDDIALVGGAK